MSDDKDIGKFNGGKIIARITCDDGVTRDIEFKIVDYDLDE